MEREQLFNYFEQRFGIGREAFSHLEFYEKSKGRIYSIDKDAFRFLDRVKPISGGLLFARIGGGIKPTSVIMQVFGKHATKNVLELDEKQTKEYVQGLDLDIPDPGACTDGYVIIKYKNYSLGIALLKVGKLKNMLQKGKRTKVEML